jgi:hypothetical protein
VNLAGMHVGSVTFRTAITEVLSEGPFLFSRVDEVEVPEAWIVAK